jgi:hypothetical protein
MASAVGAAYLFYIRPHPGLLPSVFAALRRDRAEAKGEGGQEKENRSPPLWEYRRRDRPDDRSITSKQTQVAPSPWGECRGEGGRNIFERHKAVIGRFNHPKAHTQLVLKWSGVINGMRICWTAILTQITVAL